MFYLLSCCALIKHAFSQGCTCEVESYMVDSKNTEQGKQQERGVSEKILSTLLFLPNSQPSLLCSLDRNMITSKVMIDELYKCVVDIKSTLSN